MYENIIAALPSLIRAVISLFIIVDPLGNIPIFISLTEKMNEKERRKIFQTATVTGVILLLSFALVGQQIFILFGISMQSFMIAGGILIRIFNVAITVISVLIVFLIVWITLRFIDPIYRLLGRSGSLVIARVMALIIAAIAVEYILEGIREL